MRYPNRKAKCPHCGKTLSAYVPSAHVPAVDPPLAYRFRTHTVGGKGTPTCWGWGQRVPNDAFVDGQPNLTGPTDLKNGTRILVLVDGCKREATVISKEGVFEYVDTVDFTKPLVPGYFVGLGGSYATVRAYNILKVLDG